GLISGFDAAFVQKQQQALAGIEAEVIVALRANVEIVFQLFFPDDLPAALALHPQAFRAHTLIFRGLDLTGLPLKPSQKVTSVFDTSLRHDAFLISMFDLLHLSNGIG